MRMEKIEQVESEFEQSQSFIQLKNNNYKSRTTRKI